MIDDHQLLYGKGGISARIEDNQSHDGGGAAGASLIFVGRKWNRCWS